MMLGFQGSTSSAKVYRCVACSATFNGLSSLLVHQATHASALSKVSVPPQPNSSPHETLLSNPDSARPHPRPPPLPEGVSPSFYICDCGEEFQDFSLMLDHKRSHISQPLDNKVQPGTRETPPKTHVSLGPTVNQPDLVLSCPSTSRPPAVELPTLSERKADVSRGDGIAIATTPQGQCTPPRDDCGEQIKNMSVGAEQASASVQDMHLQEKKSRSSENGENLPRKGDVMKLLASAYRNRFADPLSQNENDDKSVTPKQEVLPIDITPRAKAEVSQVKDLSIVQLKRLLAAPGIKTKAPSISRVLESSKKKVVSLTKTFSPVVVLETRQKLQDPGCNGAYGKYQCGRCRRVFQNMDKLTEHHFLHKKERIKCCRRCKQLIIGRLPLPDSHVCPQLGNKAFKNKSPFGQKLVPFHTLSNTRKVFFCPLCKHSYARRWNLKNHKCQGPRSAISHNANLLFMRSKNRAKEDGEMYAGSQISKSIAVGTEVTGLIKVEVPSPDLEQSTGSQLAWAHPAESFSSFYPKSSMMEQHKDASLSGLSLPQGEESWGALADDDDDDDDEDDDEDSNEGQWTMPLDDEMEVLSSLEKSGDGIEVGKYVSDGHTGTAPSSSLHYFVSDGIKRYPCSRCQKTYSRPSTLRRHLRLCGFRPHGLGTEAQTSGQGTIPLFPCNICGRTFNRKDNMMTHRNKCQLQKTDVDRVTVQQNVQGNAKDCQTQEDDGNNWGIMSLPSVLPRRVTCECGAGFTSPRLLLEHLQMHAQESYTCPTCGETVNSWADYEVHLQIHMHPHHQLLKGLQPQRSQPLLLRFQQQQLQPPPQQQPTAQSLHQSPQKQTAKRDQLAHATKKQQRIVCTRCGNTFATRCSLRRHVSWNRCKGARGINQPINPPKNYHCSHCNSDFPNTISLLFHQRSGTCKPPIKPVRCPVCLRWFGTVDGLQKHLLTHKRSESYRCNVCQGTYPSLKSLKNHSRRIHRIMAGDITLKTQEQLLNETT